MAALYVKKKQILAKDFNHYRTHPTQKYWAEKIIENNKLEYLHAEIAAAVTTDLENLLDSTVYIVRINKNSEIRCSYPCPTCYAFLKHVGVRRIVCCSEHREMVSINV